MQRLIIFSLVLVLYGVSIHNTTSPVAAQSEMCADSLPPHLYIDVPAEVIEGRTPNRIRTTPSLEGEFVENLYPRERVIVVDGPICADGYLWWQIQRDDADDPIGWTVAGTADEYWLEPITTALPRYELLYRQPWQQDVNEDPQLAIYDFNRGSTRLIHPTLRVFSVAWSPDGESILFPLGAENWRAIQPAMFRRVSRDGQQMETFGDGGYTPQYTPDGEWIYYRDTRDPGTGTLRRIRTDGSDYKAFSVSGSDFDIAPNNVDVAVPYDPEDGFADTIHLLDTATESLEPLYTQENAFAPQFSGNGRFLSYGAYIDKEPFIFIEDRAARNTLMTLTGNARHVSWAQDVNLFVYVCIPEDDADLAGLCLSNPTGSETETLIEPQPRVSTQQRSRELPFRDPRLSPDGRYVAYTDTRANSRMLVYDRETGITHDLNATGSTDSLGYAMTIYAWSPVAQAFPPIPEIRVPVSDAPAETTADVSPEAEAEATAEAFVTLAPSSTPLPTNTPTPRPTSTPRPTFTPTSPPPTCPGAPPSRLHIGDMARVTISAEGETREDLRVRAAPAGERIGAMSEGTEFRIVGGHVCGEGVIWWQLETLDGSLTGWSAEGIMPDDYFIEPLPTQP